METKIYNQTGKEVGALKLPESVFGLPWNADLVHQVVTSMLSERRTPIAHAKNRGEVSGGGKKPWQQKGLGRARHGSIRSPIWVGGGTTHGPRNDKNYSRKINKKMKTKALFTILSKKYKDGEILFVDSLAVTSAKTKDAKVVLNALGTIGGFDMISKKKKNAALIAVFKKEVGVSRSFKNFGSVIVEEVRNMNPVDALTFKYIVISDPKASVASIEEKI